MSQLIFNQGAAPTAPGTNKGSVYMSSADKRPYYMDEYGIAHGLANNGWTNRPVLYNGTTEFWFRQAPATPTTYSSVGGRTYFADRFWVSNENASVQAVRADTEILKESNYGNRYYATLSKITNTGKVAWGQALGSFSVMQLRGNTCRIQIKLKASTNLNIRFGLVQLSVTGTADTIPLTAGTFITAWRANTVDPTLGANLAPLAPIALSNCGTGTISGNYLTCAVTTSWQFFTAAYNVPIDCHNLILMAFTDSQIAAATTVSFGEVGLYEGMEVRYNFVPFPSALEILRCQKYYNHSFPAGVAPADAIAVATGGTGVAGIIGKAGTAALAATIPVTFPVRMRSTTPTVTLYAPVGGAGAPYRINGTNPSVQTSPAQVGVTDRGLVVTATGSASGAVGDLVGVHYTAEAEL